MTEKIKKEDYKILIVDDEKDFCEMLDRFLKKKGYNSVAISDSTVAFDYIVENNIRIAILDICMPGETGIKLLKKIKQHDDTIQCVVMTGFNSHFSFVLSLKTEADDYLTKPFDFSEIDEIIIYLIKKLERWKSVEKDFIT